MKKPITILCVILLCTVFSKAQMPFLKVETATYNAQGSFPTIQNNQARATTLSTGDTLRYFLNKHFYRNSPAGSPAPNTQYFTLSNPYTSSSFTINYCGAVFLNSSSITVTGLEGIVTRRSNATSANIPVKLYLCNVNTSNLPVFPPIDSVSAIATSTNSGAWIGGNFTTAVSVSGKFAVLYKNESTVSGDTLGMFINNACTPTSTCPAAQRYGESLGVMRINGNFQTCTNTFGTGTDYEFIVAPRILFSYTSSVSVTTPTICTNALGSFSNVSSPMNLLENRQFNFNKFAAVWGALSNTLLPTTDSIYNWAFTGSSTGNLTTKNANAFFNVTGIQTASLIVKYNKSRAGGLLTSVYDISTGTINASASNAPTLAISGSSVICAGTSVTLTANGNPTYTWTNPPSNNPVVVVSPTSNTTYTVTGVNGACVGYQTFLVNVVSNPSIVITGTSAACIGNNIVLTAAGASTFAWSNGSPDYSTTVSGSVAGVQTVTVTGQIDACPPGTAVKTITIHALPSVSLSAAVSTICTMTSGGSTVQLSGLPSGGIYTGSFVSSAGIFTPNNAANYVHTYSYTTPSTGCKNSATNTIVVSKCNAIGLNENRMNQQLVLFPNPSINGHFVLNNLEGNNIIEVYNVFGELILKELSNNSELKINLTEQPVGTYFMKVTDINHGTKTLKVIKQN